MGLYIPTNERGEKDNFDEQAAARAEKNSGGDEGNSEEGNDKSNSEVIKNDEHSNNENKITSTEKECPNPPLCGLLGLVPKASKYLASYLYSSSGGVSTEVSFSSPIALNRDGLYGLGFELGVVNTKYDIPRFYFTRKTTDESGVSFGLNANVFRILNNTGRNIKGTILRGDGFEASGSFLINMSKASDKLYLSGRESRYYIESIGFGRGIPFGYTNWDTFTTVSGN